MSKKSKGANQTYVTLSMFFPVFYTLNILSYLVESFYLYSTMQVRTEVVSFFSFSVQIIL